MYYNCKRSLCTDELTDDARKMCPWGVTVYQLHLRRASVLFLFLPPPSCLFLCPRLFLSPRPLPPSPFLFFPPSFFPFPPLFFSFLLLFSLPLFFFFLF